MSQLLNEFISSLGAGNVWYGFLLLGVFYVLKKEPFQVFRHFTQKKDKNYEQALASLQSGTLSVEANDLIREYIERQAFRQFYGIYAEQDMRHALLALHRSTDDRVTWIDIRRGYPFLYRSGKTIEVRLNFWNHAGRWFVTAISFVTGCYALFVLALAMLFKSQNQWQLIALSALSLVLLGASLLFSSMNWPYHSARKIQHQVDLTNRCS